MNYKEIKWKGFKWVFTYAYLLNIYMFIYVNILIYVQFDHLCSFTLKANYKIGVFSALQWYENENYNVGISETFNKLIYRNIELVHIIYLFI